MSLTHCVGSGVGGGSERRGLLPRRRLHGEHVVDRSFSGRGVALFDSGAVDRAGGSSPDLPREDQCGRLERGDDDPGGHGRERRAHHVRGLRLFVGRDVAE